MQGVPKTSNGTYKGCKTSNFAAERDGTYEGCQKPALSRWFRGPMGEGYIRGAKESGPFEGDSKLRVQENFDKRDKKKNR
jgi:hypothetical protein